jgi:ABC-type glycerol-3-phosphate transport system substrate-binding protein
MTRFQTIFLGVLILLGVAGAILFALAKNKGSESVPQVVMWGSLDSSVMADFLSAAALARRDAVNVSYVEKDSVSLEAELISALARGAGPDLVLLPQDFILKQRDKFYTVPFENYSERTFKDSFIEEGELYLTPQGIIGFPFSIDPLVMYWNRDLFTDAGVANPPVAWTELFALVPKFTKKDATGNILQSLVAFGEVRNVSHAKDVLSLLALQAGTPIVAYDGQGALRSVFNIKGPTLVPAESAVSYFTEFSNPIKPSYSWNRALPNDRGAFVAGRLALYFGYASELSAIRAANPNLNFDVAMAPQATGGKRMTFGSMNGIAMLRSSPNLGAAYVAAATLTDRDLQADWVARSGYAPVRRDLLSPLPGDAYRAVFYQSALISTAWLDPYREATDGVFMRMVESVTSGKLRVSEAVNQASTEIDNLLRTSI